MNNMVVKNSVNSAWWMLKMSYGIGLIICGADKFTNFLTLWTQYISPKLIDLIPISLSNLMIGFGILEIVVGILILTNFTKVGAYIAAMGTIAVIANLISMYAFLDIALLFALLAIGAIALATLTDAEEELEKNK